MRQRCNWTKDEKRSRIEERRTREKKTQKSQNQPKTRTKTKTQTNETKTKPTTRRKDRELFSFLNNHHQFIIIERQQLHQSDFQDTFSVYHRPLWRLCPLVSGRLWPPLDETNSYQIKVPSIVVRSVGRLGVFANATQTTFVCAPNSMFSLPAAPFGFHFYSYRVCVPPLWG